MIASVRIVTAYLRRGAEVEIGRNRLRFELLDEPVGRCATPLTQLYRPDTESTLPVRGVSKGQADAYCRFLDGRLPREARDLDGPYPWGSDEPTCQLANYDVCGGAVTAAHTLGSTPRGVRDLAGNVREWVYDRRAPTGRFAQRLVIAGSALHDLSAAHRHRERAVRVHASSMM